MDIGSSFLPSDVIAAFLYAQLEKIEEIQSKRKIIWNKYYSDLKHLEDQGLIQLPKLPRDCSNNAHLFYMILKNVEERNHYLSHMRENGVNPVFHYLSLHRSPYYEDKHGSRELPESDRYTETLVRLPLFFSLQEDEIEYIISKTINFFKS